MEALTIEPDTPLTPETQELLVAGRLWIYSSYIASIWSEATIYTPDSNVESDRKYDFIPCLPDGQCAPTNYLGGMILSWYGLADPEKDEIFFEEGSLLRSNGDLLSDHHAWVRVVGQLAGIQWRIDLASGQPTGTIDPNEDIHIVMQGVNHRVPHIAGVNYRRDPSIKPNFHTFTSHKLEEHDGIWGYWSKIPSVHVPNADNLRYEPESVTSFKDYDVTRFGGRLEIAAIRYHTMRNQSHGRVAIEYDQSKLWLPHGYDLSLNPTDYAGDLA